MNADDMMRLKLVIAYDGTAFHGWAVQLGQDGIRTVQGTLQEALSKVLRFPVTLTVAGRTDAGVHASGQVAHFDCPRSALDTRSLANDPANLVRRVSRLLPEDIRLSSVAEAPDGFDARFSALVRHYVYRVTTAPAGPLPVRARDTASWPKSVDIEAMRKAAEPLIGLHDFAAFCRAKPDATTVRDLKEFTWHDVSTPEEPELYEAHVAADAFCWSMVRSLVGACLAVGEGRRSGTFTTELLQKRERSADVPVAPARGLSLVKVDYPDASELAQRAADTRGVRVLDGEEHRAIGKGCPDTNPFYNGVD